MNLASYMAFGDELRKIAGVSLDADTRANMAERAGLEIGKNYLPGGELPSNDPTQTNFIPKLAEIDPEGFESKTYKKYKRYREPGSAALKGALAGSFIGNLIGPAKLGKNPIRAGALLGGGLGVADWAASGKARKWTSKKKRKKTQKPELPELPKTAMSDHQTFTSGRELSRTRQTGSFQDSRVHVGTPLRPLKTGQKFSIPSDPTQ